MISYSLPFPPTVNGLFVEVNGKRIKTKPYRAWRDAAGWAIKQQQVGAVRKSITGPVSVLIECTRPDNRKRDLDNLLKGVLDLIVELRVIDDDSAVQHIEMEWVRQGPPCQVTVSPWHELRDPAVLVVPAQ